MWVNLHVRLMLQFLTSFYGNRGTKFPPKSRTASEPGLKQPRSRYLQCIGCKREDATVHIQCSSPAPLSPQSLLPQISIKSTDAAVGRSLPKRLETRNSLFVTVCRAGDGHLLLIS